jgi:hypothetical protein
MVSDPANLGHLIGRRGVFGKLAIQGAFSVHVEKMGSYPKSVIAFEILEPQGDGG